MFVISDSYLKSFRACLLFVPVLLLSWSCQQARVQHNPVQQLNKSHIFKTFALVFHFSGLLLTFNKLSSPECKIQNTLFMLSVKGWCLLTNLKLKSLGPLGINFHEKNLIFMSDDKIPCFSTLERGLSNLEIIET